MPCHLMCLSLALTMGIGARISAQQSAEPYAEIEIIRGEQVSELKVYVINPGPNTLQFLTGARGRGGDVHVDEMAGSVTGLTVLPRLAFEWKSGDGHKPQASFVDVRAPVYRSDWRGRQAPELEHFKVAPGERRFYYAFKVPTEYVRGAFKGGELSRHDTAKPRGYQPLTKEEAIYEKPDSGYGPVYVGAIRITRLIEASDKEESKRQK